MNMNNQINNGNFDCPSDQKVIVLSLNLDSEEKKQKLIKNNLNNLKDLFKYVRLMLINNIKWKKDKLD